MGQSAACCVERSSGSVEPIGPQAPGSASEPGDPSEVFHECKKECGEQGGGREETVGVSGFKGVPPVSIADSTAAAGTGASGDVVGLVEEGQSPSPSQAAAWTASDGLTLEQEKRLMELQLRLLAEPEPPIAEHAMEDRRARHLRFLRGEGFAVEAAFRRLHGHSAWWRAYGMDSFVEEDELDETGPLFVCGEDLQGRPTLVARPCVHRPKSRAESLRAARRCVYTIQRCVERYRPGVRCHSVIYDAHGLQPRCNLDLVFVREAAAAVSDHFPGRLHRVVVINVHWTMAAFWAAIGPLLHPTVKAKMTCCGADFRGELEKLVGPDHPYLRYALQVRSACKREASSIPVPRHSPYVRGWEAHPPLREACLSNASSLSSIQTTTATEADLDHSAK